MEAPRYFINGTEVTAQIFEYERFISHENGHVERKDGDLYLTYEESEE